MNRHAVDLSADASQNTESIRRNPNGVIAPREQPVTSNASSVVASAIGEIPSSARSLDQLITQLPDSITITNSSSPIRATSDLITFSTATPSLERRFLEALHPPVLDQSVFDASSSYRHRCQRFGSH